MANKIEKTADVILDRPKRFFVKGLFGLKLRFGVKPLRGRNLVRIAEQAEKIRMVPESEILSIIGTAGENIKPICKVVAYSVLGSSLKVKIFGRFLTRYFEEYLTPAELYQLLQLVLSQSGVKELFQSTILIRMIVPATLMTVKSEEEKPSGEKSQE
jgi:hypothetical protein